MGDIGCRTTAVRTRRNFSSAWVLSSVGARSGWVSSARFLYAFRTRSEGLRRVNRNGSVRTYFVQGLHRFGSWGFRIGWWTWWSYRLTWTARFLRLRSTAVTVEWSHCPKTTLSKCRMHCPFCTLGRFMQLHLRNNSTREMYLRFCVIEHYYQMITAETGDSFPQVDILPERIWWGGVPWGGPGAPRDGKSGVLMITTP